MFMESKDLPLRGPSFLFEYMFKCCPVVLCSSYLNYLRYVKWADYPERQRALLFNHRATEEGAIISPTAANGKRAALLTSSGREKKGGYLLFHLKA